MILLDQQRHGKLTGYPLEVSGSAVFPVAAKLKHLELEKGAAAP
jgi:hypothetical protein